jgi:hypothetical protein
MEEVVSKLVLCAKLCDHLLGASNLLVDVCAKLFVKVSVTTLKATTM